jgi:sugar lactone lactonase YvrE
MVYPKVSSKTQAVVPNYSLNSIATLSILPYIETDPGRYAPISATTGNPTTPEAADLLRLELASPSIDPNRPFVIRHLKPSSKYRILARAYDSSNAVISKDDTSYVDVNVTDGDAPGMASLPVYLADVPFAATTSVKVNTAGRFDYLKSTLFLAAGNSQLAVSTTIRTNPEISLSNLQRNTNYRLLAEAYKLGGVMASQSLDISIGEDNAPATRSLALSIPYYISTLAGNGTANFAGDGGNATLARLNSPCGIAVDGTGNLFFADGLNHRIRKITPEGIITTIAGNGTNASSGDGGMATLACISEANGLVMDTSGNVYFSEPSKHRVRKIATNGIITTIAGNGIPNYTGDGGQATLASLKGPYGLALDGQGALYIADNDNSRIRKVTVGGIISTVAGNGAIAFSGDGGAATSASLNVPIAVDVDGLGNLYICDLGNARIRKVSPNGVITTFAGQGSWTFSGDGGPATLAGICPRASVSDGEGNLYFIDENNNRIRKITTNGIIRTIAGNGLANFAGDGGQATLASLNVPKYLSVDREGNLYITDFGNHRIRKLY